ncbi:MAG TPA: hypothetical protein VEC37_06315 [Bacillota bacterium]|nr:hypothetical protein [Bacillota bacterium]
MFDFFKPKNNVNLGGPVPSSMDSLPFKFEPASIKVDTSTLKAKIVSVQPTGVLGRAWHFATKDFLGNVGATAGTIAANVILDKSMEYLIRSFPLLVRSVGWGTSFALSALPIIGRFMATKSTGLITYLARISTWFSPAAVVANNTSLPTEIKHIITVVDPKTVQEEPLGRLRKMIENTTNPKVSEQVVEQLPSTITSNPAPLAETAAKVVEATLPGHSWLYYTGCVTGVCLGLLGLVYTYRWFTTETPVLNSKLFHVDPTTGLVKPTEAASRVINIESLPSVDPTWPEQSGFTHILTYLMTGVLPVGGFTLYMFLPKSFRPANMEDIDPTFVDNGVEVGVLTKKNTKGTISLPKELVNASPTEKAKYLAETKQKTPPELHFEEPKLEQIPQPEPLPPQLEAVDRFINELTLEEMQTIMSSPKFLAWQSQPEQYAFAFDEIMQSPDRMAAILQVFGAN